jgi:hypothetical protein
MGMNKNTRMGYFYNDFNGLPNRPLRFKYRDSEAAHENAQKTPTTFLSRYSRLLHS